VIHVKALEIPANTPAAGPEEMTVKLGSCIIRHAGIEFPRGCYWLVGVRMRLREHQLYPTTPGEWIVSEGQLIEWDDNTAIIDTPYEVTVTAYNLDERYAHTIRVYLDVEELSPTGVYVAPATVQTGYVA
jgi:hypothetical protein